MKIQVFSDLHLEFSHVEPPKREPDLVILAGDISTKAKGVQWANQAFTCPVLYVAGNHEFYGGHIDRTLSKMRGQAAPHVHILENQSFIWQQTRFLGTTAWTDFTSTGDQLAASQIAWGCMNDFRAIRADTSYRRLRPDDVIQRNHAASDWLKAELTKPFPGKTVVITHHAPTNAVVGDKHDGHLNAAYANEWGSLIEMSDAWIFGHTHQAVDVRLSGCRVVSNPRGYPDEDTGFNAALEIEL